MDRPPAVGIAVALWLASVLAFLPGLGGSPVWSKDEARPGLVARDMVATGHWAIPHIGGRVYVEKPPLFMWTVALFSRRGVTEWSLRLPSVLAAATTVVVTFAITARLVGTAAGVMAGAVLATSFTMFQWARTGRMEAMLTLWIALSVWSLIRWLAERRSVDALAFGLWVGLGVLTKGPAAFLPVAVGALALIGRGRSRAGVGRAVGLATLATASLVLVWIALAAVEPSFVSYAAGVGPRFAQEMDSSRSRSALDLKILGAGMFPWSLAVPGAVLVVVRGRRELARTLAVPLLWAGVVLLIFAVLMRPREPHFLPVYPALAILVAWAWWAASPRTRWAMAAPLLAVLAGVVVLGVVACVSGVTVPIHRARMPVPLGLAVLAVTVAAATLLVAIAGLRVGRPTVAGVVIAIGTIALYVAAEIGIHTPGLNMHKSARVVAAQLAARLPSDAEIDYIDRRGTTTLMFYLPQRSRQIRLRDDLTRLPPPGSIVMLPDDYLGGLRAAAADRFVLLAQFEFDDDGYIVAGFR